jgi:hypothetical protein
MVQATIRRFGAIRALLLVGLLGIAPIASTAVPAVGSSNTWTPTGSMTNARTHHTATLLANGEVLVAGGLSNGGSPIGTSCTSTAELYDPSTGQWATTGSMTITRGNHTAKLLPNGKVLVAGGLCSTASLTWTTVRSSMIHPRARGKPPAA